MDLVASNNVVEADQLLKALIEKGALAGYANPTIASQSFATYGDTLLRSKLHKHTRLLCPAWPPKSVTTFLAACEAGSALHDLVAGTSIQQLVSKWPSTHKDSAGRTADGLEALFYFLQEEVALVHRADAILIVDMLVAELVIRAIRGGRRPTEPLATPEAIIFKVSPVVRSSSSTENASAPVDNPTAAPSAGGEFLSLSLSADVMPEANNALQTAYRPKPEPSLTMATWCVGGVWHASAELHGKIAYGASALAGKAPSSKSVARLAARVAWLRVHWPDASAAPFGDQHMAVLPEASRPPREDGRP